MTTVGLKGIWVLEKIDKSDSSTWRIGAKLIGGGLFFGAGAYVLFVSMDAAIELNTAADFVFVVPTLLGVWLFVTIYLARTTEKDLDLLSRLDTSISEDFSKLIINKAPLLATTIAGIPVMPFTFLGPSVLKESLTISDTINENVATQFAFYFLVPLFGMTLGPVFCSLYAQCRCLISVAQRIQIDLFRLPRYSTISNAVVRYLIVYLAIMAVFPIATIWSDDPEKALAIVHIFFFFSIPALCIIVGYGFPVLILRNRIIEMKEQLLLSTEQSLSARESKPQDRTSSLSDELAYYQFIESRWNWPVAAHLQKLILFGLLPPLSWVLAALIENSLF